MSLGIDLAVRGLEIRKILFAGFSQTIRNNHWDDRDVLQAVFVKIATSNKGAHPFDPAKASFGHYVHMVCSSVIRNMHRSDTRTRNREVLQDEDSNTLDHHPDAGPSPLDSLIARDLSDVIREQLDGKQRHVFEARLLGESLGPAANHTALSIRRVARQVLAA